MAEDRSGYVLGDSRSELVRLERQARFYAPATEALFTAAGIGPGMRVLDIGSGAGDVSMLAARLVGPGGQVVGIERSPQAVETARARAKAAGLPQCRFEVTEIDAFETGEQFDAVVGRLILLYLPDPVATIRRLSRLLKSGGVAALQELYLSAARGYPDSALLDLCMHATKTAFAHVNGDLDLGLKLFEIIGRAGLPDPAMLASMPIATRTDPEGYQILVGLMRTLLPVLEQFDATLVKELDIDTLDQRFFDEVSKGGHIYLWPPLIGAWTRKP